MGRMATSGRPICGWMTARRRWPPGRSSLAIPASSILERIHSSDDDVVMPPPSSNRTLSAEQKALLARWVAAGAEYRKHWAFEPPARPEPPAVNHGGWVRNGIDVFILAGLEGAGMKPSPKPTGRPSSAASQPI